MKRRNAAILAVSVAIAFIALGFTYHLNGNSLDPTHKQLVLVTTDSMNGDVTEYDIDSFPAGTLVVIENLSDYEMKFLRVGDVISYYKGNTLVHHRVTQVERGMVYVHGDNNHTTEAIALEDVNGRVVGTSTELGHLITFVSDHNLLFLMIMFVLSATFAVYAMLAVPKTRRRGVL